MHSKILHASEDAHSFLEISRDDTNIGKFVLLGTVSALFFDNHIVVIVWDNFEGSPAASRLHIFLLLLIVIDRRIESRWLILNAFTTRDSMILFVNESLTSG